MSPLIIVAISFTALLIGVLVWVLATSRVFAPVQQTVVILFEALCAGFASGCYIGDVRLQASGKLEGLDIVLTAGGGFAVFIIVAYAMSRLLKALGKSGAGESIAWPDKASFRNVVTGYVRGRGLQERFVGFVPQQLDTKLTAGKLQAKTRETLLEGLANRAMLPAVHVEIDEPNCTLTIGEASP